MDSTEWLWLEEVVEDCNSKEGINLSAIDIPVGNEVLYFVDSNDELVLDSHILNNNETEIALVSTTTENPSSDQLSSQQSQKSRQSGIGSQESASSLEPDPRPRRGRQQKLALSKAERKLYRNSNKPYLTEKGIFKEERDFRFYICNCSLKCEETVNEETRRRVWSKFWDSGTYVLQQGFIASNIEELFVKRKRVNESTRRQYTRVYYIEDTQVCRSVFQHTLRVSPCRINTAIKKLKHSPTIKDCRGSVGGGWNKLSKKTIRLVKAHINSFPKYKSHYTREKTKRQYLNPELTNNLMFTLFTEKYPNVKCSQSSYIKIFVNNFNLRRKRWQKDTCNKCDLFVVQIQNAVGKEELQNKLQAEHDQHVREADATRALMHSDFEAVKNDPDLEVISFDLEKTLPIPRIPSNWVYYKRQLCFYNLGIRSARQKKGYCYTWIETEASRGAQEIGSCLRKHILANDNTKKLILWCDSCGGQNRNIKLTLMLKAVLEECSILESITIRFLISGHSMMKNDSDFGDIECKLKGVSRLYTADDYRHVIKTCRTRDPLIVVTMVKEDFVSTALIEKSIVNRKKSSIW